MTILNFKNNDFKSHRKITRFDHLIYSAEIHFKIIFDCDSRVMVAKTTTPHTNREKYLLVQGSSNVVNKCVGVPFTLCETVLDTNDRMSEKYLSSRSDGYEIINQSF